MIRFSLVPVALDSAEYGDAVVRLDVPQPEVVVIGHREQQVRVLCRTETRLTNRH